jgi:hypothetical protein
MIATAPELPTTRLSGVKSWRPKVRRAFVVIQLSWHGARKVAFLRCSTSVRIWPIQTPLKFRNYSPDFSIINSSPSLGQRLRLPGLSEYLSLSDQRGLSTGSAIADEGSAHRIGVFAHGRESNKA